MYCKLNYIKDCDACYVCMEPEVMYCPGGDEEICMRCFEDLEEEESVC